MALGVVLACLLVTMAMSASVGVNEGVSELCPPGSTELIPHPTLCTQYYNCSAGKQSYYWPEHLMECDYPEVWNVITAKCEHYTMVDCGDREQPKGHCDYRKHNCDTAHCMPCFVRYPNCKGLPDGLNEWEGKSNSPYFAVCVDERAVYSGACPGEYGTPIFDKLKRTCVPATA